MTKDGTENLWEPDCIRTFTGKYINVFEPDPELICIEDIAHALSMQPRFGGHLPEFYSVAQHSWLVSVKCPKELWLTGLMHDAGEPYLIDVPSPVKARLTNYKEIEDRLMKAIAEKFGFEWPLPDLVKQADRFMLEFEWKYIMLGGSALDLLPPKSAETLFLELFHELTLGLWKA